MNNVENRKDKGNEALPPRQEQPQPSLDQVLEVSQFWVDRAQDDLAKAQGDFNIKNAKRLAEKQSGTALILRNIAKRASDVGDLRDKVEAYRTEISTGDDINPKIQDRETKRAENALDFLRQFRMSDLDMIIERRRRGEEVGETHRTGQEKEAQVKTETTGEIEAAYREIGVESPSERERTRERIVDMVMKDAGVRIMTSIEGKKVSHGGHNGFQDMETRVLAQNDVGGRVVAEIENQFFSYEERTRGGRLGLALEEHGIRELIDIRHETQPKYETVVVQGKKGFLGLGQTPDRTERKYTGRESALHSALVIGGKNEPAVIFRYYIPQTREWRDYGGRTGQCLAAEIILPESDARELEKTLDNDPIVIRRIVERMMKEKMLKDPTEWEKSQSQGDSLRPPYEKWDSEPGGGRVYIQKEGENPGFHEESFHKVKK